MVTTHPVRLVLMRTRQLKFNYFGGYVAMERESTSPMCFVFLITSACVLFFSFNLFCGRNRSGRIKHISRHAES